LKKPDSKANNFSEKQVGNRFYTGADLFSWMSPLHQSSCRLSNHDILDYNFGERIRVIFISHLHGDYLFVLSGGVSKMRYEDKKNSFFFSIAFFCVIPAIPLGITVW